MAKVLLAALIVRHRWGGPKRTTAVPPSPCARLRWCMTRWPRSLREWATPCAPPSRS